ncbi:MAG: hypothetical protein NZO58_09760, partial [Gemmataceae bacterium]|nr:hypothetical protein [Gemmataceae bacterium]
DKDESPPEHDPPSGVYVYRNVFDQRGGVYYGLPTRADAPGDFLHHEGHLLSDHGNPVYPVLRFYHNTFVRHKPVWRDYFLFGLGAVGLRRTERDVFNNIFVQSEGMPGTVVLGNEAGDLREGGNLLWGINEGPNLKHDPLARFRASPLFVASRQRYAPGWTTQDRIGDPKFLRYRSDRAEDDFRLQRGSAAVDAGVPLPRDWPDPLRVLDAGLPDAGAAPLGVEAWGVGVDGRIPGLRGRL